ncbi:2,3-diaminopropionate biosynthesis protein SbnB, partial [Streptomyces sp. 2MCAF27]
TLADLLRGRLHRQHGRPAIFSPFGLGVLDLAVGKWVHDRVVAAGRGHRERDFFTGVGV